ncbi:hypothetical protein HPB52_016089 [Rhipicephalus sanguineus]|uniref:P-type domain-containing protein n=1 Tax=Rhipicephalus sanguineus TaxID=34632 RepID=A0A9D4SZ61_RHISA|nr:hypothetical protein HPB52_016089 [Rhipicephalus sanguineus]
MQIATKVLVPLSVRGAGEEDEEEGSSSNAEDGTSAESALAGGGVTFKPQQHRKRCCDDDFSSLSTRLRCLLAAVIVLLVLTAVFVPLYYFVFREHLGPLWRTLFWTRATDASSGGVETTVGGTTLDETLAPFQTTPAWKPQCPEAPVLEWNRFDCFPENPDVDLSTCEDRGCCWAVTNVRNDKDGPAAREHYRSAYTKGASAVREREQFSCSAPKDGATNAAAHIYVYDADQIYRNLDRTCHAVSILATADFH